MLKVKVTCTKGHFTACADNLLALAAEITRLHNTQYRSFGAIESLAQVIKA